MIHRTFILILAGLLVIAPLRAQAQMLPKNQVEEMSMMAHSAMPGAMAGQKLITQEEASKLQYPLVPYETREETIVRGYLAGFAAWCGLNWQNMFFLPYMGYVRGTHKDWNDYQFAYVGILHGTAMKTAILSKEGTQCTADEKEKVAAKAMR